MKKNKVWYVTKKLLIFMVSLLLLSVITFYISRLAPGDPLVSYYGDRVEKMSTEERAGAARTDYGSVRPLAWKRAAWKFWDFV